MILAINQFNDILLESAFGILVVFTALTSLVIAFTLTSRINRKTAQIKKRKVDERLQHLQDADLSGEEVAAIAMALQIMLSEEHDEESNIITIKRIERRYSPWNSKIYGVSLR